MNKIKKYCLNFVYASQIIFSASKRYFIFKTLLALVLSLLPYLPLFLWRELINDLTSFTVGKTETLLNAISFFAVAYCVIVLIEKFLKIISQFITFKYNDAIDYYLDNLMVDRVSAVDLEFFDSSNLRDHVKNSWNLIYSTKNMVTFVFDMVQGIIRVVVSFSLMLTLSFWLIPVIILLCIPSIISDKSIEQTEYSFEKKHAKSKRKLEYYKEIFFGDIRNEIRLYRLKDYFISRYDNVWKDWNCAYCSKEWQKALLSMGMMIILTVNEVIIYAFLITKLIVGKIAVGDVAYYVSLASQFRTDVNVIAERINTFERNTQELNDVRSFIEMKPLLEKSGKRIPSKDPIIEFKNVSFHYPNAKKNVLHNCSFTIKSGETIGLVGLNGSGKSTILKLLCRFYDPTEGQILIDGIDAREYDIVQLRALFGVLFQDYVKYSFSLRENVALSDETRMNDDIAIMDACERSHVTDFSKDWENGLNENLTRRFDSKGKELSGGQWQRISLARAFFRDAPIALLDEPSAALDPVAEHQIFEDFTNISKDKSAVLISHRLSSITLCDKVLVLEDGRIIEQGSHRELLEKNGRYAYLFKLQADKYHNNK